MRFIRKELSPANKRQYLLALGRKDIELLLGEAKQAYRYMPSTAPLREDRQRLNGIIKGLAEALKQAEADGDDYDRVPVAQRQAYKNYKEDHPLTDITRFEIIDHSRCRTCKGKGHVLKVPTELTTSSALLKKLCPDCRGLTCKGREVIYWDERKEMTSSVQDDGRTLKIFIDDRKPLPKPELKVELKDPQDTSKHLIDAWAFFLKTLKEEAEKIKGKK
jgi:hypothetical protein